MNFQYKIGCRLENLKGMRDFIQASLKDFVVSEVELSEIILAIDEMCCNRIIYEHKCDENHSLELHIIVPNPKKIIFELQDKAGVFDINKYHDIDIKNLIFEKRKGGLGVKLVKSIMDKIEYISRDGQSVCRMTRRIN